MNRERSDKNVLVYEKCHAEMFLSFLSADSLQLIQIILPFLSYAVYATEAQKVKKKKKNERNKILIINLKILNLKIKFIVILYFN